MACLQDSTHTPVLLRDLATTVRIYPQWGSRVTRLLAANVPRHPAIVTPWATWRNVNGRHCCGPPGLRAKPAAGITRNYLRRGTCFSHRSKTRAACGRMRRGEGLTRNHLRENTGTRWSVDTTGWHLSTLNMVPVCLRVCRGHILHPHMSTEFINISCSYMTKCILYCC